LGGNASDNVRAVAVEDSGAILVGGTTFSSDFPANGSLEPPLGGGDSFLPEVYSSGST
jgi:hypothetical protein